MKIRIGIAPPAGGGADRLAEVIDDTEELGIDSLWLSELVYGPPVDPFVGMAYALSRTRRLKVGTGVVILPGRHPVRVAKQLVSLAALAPGRVLPAFGLLPARPNERDAFPVPGPRGAVFDESLELVRTLLRQDRVTFKGEFYSVEDAHVGPLPAKPLDIWLGGSGPVALRRVGRFADGWLASFVTPDEADAARQRIEAHATAYGREIEPDHFGISIAVGEPSEELVAALRRRRPGVDPTAFVPADWRSARELIERYVEAGLTKFVVRQARRTPYTKGFLQDFARELMPLEN